MDFLSLPAGRIGASHRLNVFVLLLLLQDSPLVLQSDRNVTVNARNDQGHVTGQLTIGEDAHTITNTHTHTYLYTLAVPVDQTEPDLDLPRSFLIPLDTSSSPRPSP